MKTLTTTVYVEVRVTRRNYWGAPEGVEIGRTWKRLPRQEQIPTGSIVVQIPLSIPADRLVNVVEAAIPAAEPIALTK